MLLNDKKAEIKKPSIAILGCRGIPNHYGGFEELAEHLSIGLVRMGYDVSVYNAHHHPCPDLVWKGVKRLFCHDPESRIGPAGQFIYDLNCINDSRKRGFDVIIQLGYTSSSIWHKRLPANAKIVTNMDGLEWQRQKYSRLARRFLRYAEKLAVRSSDTLIADNMEIKNHILKRYGMTSIFIPYGADNCLTEKNDDNNDVKLFIADKKMEQAFSKNSYYLMIARLQPDNHIEEIIRGFLSAAPPEPLIVVGDFKNRFGKKLYKKHGSGNVVFAGSIFQSDLLNRLRSQAKLYFHGHSVGGTNPSLLQAMAASVPICAHDNPFNRSVLGEDAFYFKTPSDISSVINQKKDTTNQSMMIRNNLTKIKNHYRWDSIVRSYETIIRNIIIKEEK